MSNLFDYITWRGDLSFENDKLNELDNIIFARLSYLPFKEIEFKSAQTIEELSLKFIKLNKSKFLWPFDDKLIEMLGESARFKDLKVSDYVEVFDDEAEKQYASITIHLPENKKYLSYRGTDSTIVGWKEDFNMSFAINIPSQLEAVKYINKIGKKYPDSSLILGGHSKGGNVAVYAGIYADENVKSRIELIINAEGPGFPQNVMNDIRYEKIKDKIKTFIPQESVIGRIMEHQEDYIVIRSNQKGIMQHDIYSWEVGPRFLIQIKEVTHESQVMNNFTNEWLNSTTPESREKVINVLYEILAKSDVKNTSDISKALLKNTKVVLGNLKNMNEDDKKEIENMINQVMKLIKNIIKEEIETKTEIITSKIRNKKVKK